MILKKCGKCKEEKPLIDFHKKKGGKYGVEGRCKKCKKQYRQDNKERIKEYRKQYYQENKERRKQYRKQHYQENKERIKQYHKQYQQKNKERIKQYRQDNKERIKDYNKQRYQDNKERIKQYHKQYYQENKERKKQYRQDNKERLAKCRNERRKQRRQSDPMFKLKGNLRRRTNQAFRSKGYSKKSKTKEMLGVEWEILKKHIERQFTKGMSWDNYGKWHVDHIVPLASAKTEEEVIKLCHYSNLQPLWAKDNLSKNDKIEPTQVKLRI